MTRELLEALAKEKKINLNDYDYYYATIVGKFLYIEFSVRCGIGVCAPLVMKEIKLSATALDKRNAQGKSDFISWDYVTDGNRLYIKEIK